MKRVVTLVVFLCLATTPAVAEVLYVSQSAAGNNTGASWRDAFHELQDALALAKPGDEIWVAVGVYSPTSGNDRFATFQLANGVAIYGGFTGDVEIVRLGSQARVSHCLERVLEGTSAMKNDLHAVKRLRHTLAVVERECTVLQP